MAERVKKMMLDMKELSLLFFEDTRLIGILTSAKDYQFCWHINNATGFDFRLNPELEIPMQRNGRYYHFPVYEYKEKHRLLSHYIYKNQHDGEYLIAELRHFDFLWLIKGEEINDSFREEIMQIIRDVPQVQLVVALHPEKIKEAEFLIF
ncbi:MAG: IPExxxVDY family protein [Chitinophagaceae bacterium]|nr:IPExxxVDY family protein [Chitinophagaceae bacterium]